MDFLVQKTSTLLMLCGFESRWMDSRQRGVVLVLRRHNALLVKPLLQGCGTFTIVHLYVSNSGI